MAARLQGGLSMAGRRLTAEPHGIDAVTRFLDDRGVRYETVEHDATYSALAEARAAAADPEATAKTVVLHDRGGVRLAVVPVSERLTCGARVRSSAPAAICGSPPRRSCGGTSRPSSSAPCRRSGRRRSRRSSTCGCFSTSGSSTPASTGARWSSMCSTYSASRSPGWRTSARTRKTAGRPRSTATRGVVLGLIAHSGTRTR